MANIITERNFIHKNLRILVLKDKKYIIPYSYNKNVNLKFSMQFEILCIIPVSETLLALRHLTLMAAMFYPSLSIDWLFNIKSAVLQLFPWQEQVLGSNYVGSWPSGVTSTIRLISGIVMFIKQ